MMAFCYQPFYAMNTGEYEQALAAAVRQYNAVFKHAVQEDRRFELVLVDANRLRF
jgi:hypothetical protein